MLRPILFCLSCFCCLSGSAAKPSVDFESQIAPMLAEHCVRCHSPGNRKGDVSLATVDDLRENDFVTAGSAEESYLIELVTASGDQPPAMPKDAAPLGDAEVELLRRWIDEGAHWPADVEVREQSKADTSWWSLQPLAVTQPPPAAGIPDAWSTHPIDRFVSAKLATEGLSPSPPADRRTLIRRLYVDLLGLPPTPQAVEAFVNDPDPKAYVKLVDRLLGSHHYGERYARHWLDIAHYADTHGFERDRRRDHAWRYRDYVINAFNEDKPYDRFIREQIAGDVLWPDDERAVIATGFLAAGPWDFVGQVETKSPQLRRSARSLDLDDMVTQVMTATVGLTINCARCHDHKLDPISQQEYYQLRAVFAGVRRDDRVTGKAALEQHETNKKQLTRRLNELDFSIGRLEGSGLDLADLVGGGNGLGSGVYRQGIDARTGKVQTRDFGRLGNVVANRFSATQSKFIDGVFIPNGHDGQSIIPVTSTGITITGLPTTSGEGWDRIRNGPVASQHSPVLGGIDFTAEGHSLLGLHANAGITFDLNAIRAAVVDQETTDSDPAVRFTAKVGFFGAEGSHHADSWVFVDGAAVAEYRRLKRSQGLQDVDVTLPPNARFLTLVATDGGNGIGHDQVGWGDPTIRSAARRALDEDDARRLAELRQDRARLRRQLERLGPPPQFYGVVAADEVPEVRVLLRGDPESPVGDPLQPAALSALEMLPPQLGSRQTNEGRRRAALAAWITDPNNPLTARVIVNRLWQWHFGSGIVDTPSDFGYGGGRPSHPELLDWLAAEISNRRWSLKAMHRLILTSQTYRQTSRFGEADPRARVDADNRLLWRQNPRRLEAEALRDAVLSVAGTLNTEPGGPGFEDFEYTDAYAPIYQYVTADKPSLWRRSIYRYIVRTTPNRFMTTLDCPDPANLTPKRLTTTTPLQSLALYNNEFMLLQARQFADRVEHEAGRDVEHQVARAWTLAFHREPTQRERQLATRLVREQSLFALCRSLFNANEFIYVD